MILVGGTILPGGRADEAAAIAWAAGTILAIGTEAEVLAISRGDSQVVEVPGCFVVPTGAPLEIGAAADLAVLDRDPRVGGASPRIVAVVAAGRLVAGGLLGLGRGDDRDHHDHGVAEDDGGDARSPRGART
jgi:predicted amidohydrolase YtcJ